MKKVLFILPSLSVGGLEKVQVTLANALVDRGYDVTIMTLDADNDLLPLLDKRVKYVHKPYKPHKIMKSIPYIRNKFYDDGMWETRASSIALYKYYVGNEKYDVEIAFFRGLPIKIISGSTNVKSVKLAWVHNDFRKASGYLNSFRNLKSVREAYTKFDKVICVSNEAKDGFKNVIGDTGNLITIYNILPINNIIDLSKEEPQISVPKSKFNLVLVGRLLDSAKGQIRLIKVVTSLRNEGYDLSLTLVGGGVDEGFIKKTINNLSANDYIFMVGSQANPYPFIAKSDLLVCASFFEGYNLTVAEALILGVPVLSTNCAGPNEILDFGKYGVLVDNSEEGLYNGIKKLFDNPETLSYYKQKAKERISFFDEEMVIDKVLGLIEKK